MSIQVDESTIFNTVSRVYSVALQVFDSEGMQLACYSPDPESSEYLVSISPCKDRLFQLCAQTKKPQIVSSEINQLWGGVPVLEDGKFGTLILVGPVHTTETSKIIIVNYTRVYGIAAQPREKLLAALTQVRVCPYDEFSRLIALVYELIYREALDTASLGIDGLSADPTATAAEIGTDSESLAEVQSVEYTTVMFAQRLQECIREGKLDELKRHLKTARYDDIWMYRAIDPVRRQKNMTIALVTRAMQAAIDGGLSPEVAYSLNDMYLQQLETMNSLLPILTLSRSILYDFTTRVRELHRPRQYSKLITDCCSYIEANVRDNLRVTDVAAYAGYHEHYIARRFKEETGQSIRDYIKAAKTAEAKSLLRYSKLSLSEISDLLAFSSQSFFTATFKQVTGMTPRQYRESV